MKNLLGNIGLAIFSLLVTEIALRLIGFSPHPDLSDVTDLVSNTKRFALDQELGWVNAKGKKSFKLSSGREYTVNVLEDGSRDVGPDSEGVAKGTVVILGGSYLYGFNLSDEQTLAWKLNQSSLGYRVKNFAVSGYGTLQSLMMLEGVLKKKLLGEDLSNLRVIYGIIPHHLPRNGGDLNWRRFISARNSINNIVMPYCSLTASGDCDREVGEFLYPRTFFGRYLATVHLLEIIIGSLKFKNPEDYTSITSAILEEFRNVVEEAGGQFALMLLDGTDEEVAEILRASEESDLEINDCRAPKDDNKDYFLKGDPHPNETLNDYWLNCFEGFLGK